MHQLFSLSWSLVAASLRQLLGECSSPCSSACYAAECPECLKATCDIFICLCLCFSEQDRRPHFFLVFLSLFRILSNFFLELTPCHGAQGALFRWPLLSLLRVGAHLSVCWGQDVRNFFLHALVQHFSHAIRNAREAEMLIPLLPCFGHHVRTARGGE